MTTPSRSSDYALALGPGTRLVQYEIERVLGQGSFGITYLASEPLLGDLGEKVAIKEFLPCDLAGRATDRDTVVPHTPERRDLFQHGLEKFLEEARRLKLLSKGSPPNIVPVRTAFEANGTAYLVMDYYEGKTLSAYIGSGSPSGAAVTTRKLEAQDAVGIMVQVLHGLAAVHEKGFVHRDIKPDNIYLRFGKDGSREALLLDFGAARQALLEQKRTADWTVVLSRGYAPPEQYQRSGEQGPWTDIYACAAVLYQLITGEVPPDGDLRERAAEGLLKGEDVELVPPSRVAPDCPPAIDAAILRGLALDPRERPQTAFEFVELLEQEEPVVEAAPPQHAPTVVMDHGATVVLDGPSGAGADQRAAGRPSSEPSKPSKERAPSRAPRERSAPGRASKRPDKSRKRLIRSPAAAAALGLLTVALGAAGYFQPWNPPPADALPRGEPAGTEEMDPIALDEVESPGTDPTEPAARDQTQSPDIDREGPSTGATEPPAVAANRSGAGRTERPATSTPDREPPVVEPERAPATPVTPASREVVDDDRTADAPASREPTIALPTAAELGPVAEALVLGNIHLEGARFNQAAAVVSQALRQVGQLLSRYPEADTLHTLQRELRRLGEENRANCMAVAEVVGGDCPGGGG